MGKDGTTFTMYKFRTMHSDVNPYEEAPHAPDDERIIFGGRFLRRSSLDELPQLWNVLRGEMSLVGPRPEMRFIVEQYEEWQRRRLDVKPGITGLWQVKGRGRATFEGMIDMDIEYIRHSSLLLDLKILFLTIYVVLTGTGAE